MKLSHSAKEKYLTCPEKWRLYYQEKLRSKKLNSPLFFGRAIDEALNRILLDKKAELTEEEKEIFKKTEREIFIDNMLKTIHNNDVVDLPKNKDCLYFKSDVDTSLLDLEDIKDLDTYSKEVDYVGIFNPDAFISYCHERFKNKKQLTKEEQLLYNYTAWKCLYRKGLMLLEAYRRQILPQIENVITIQEKVELPDEDDIFIGYIDFIASFVEEPGVEYVCDNKTSSKAYKKDSVRTSPQLSIYSEYKENDNCAFIVLEKKIRKRSPKVRTSIIKDKINELQRDETFDNITNVYHDIKDGKFFKNKENCFQFGRPCEYYKLCHYGDKSDLIQLENNDGKEKSSIDKNKS